ncbi:LANO_0G09186g1_1 [Lachancea nothofagi CBS 11611]|uniref:LANO_0G09186g1_1 n=1 Tax=Lachancea nothofagi CBS 11611 TaxID=1266666 RepID=A0A1G4KI79_9SACH|nr:LANO_0G09186g1_1 [Lachancea nothofagi CBS 11611]
MSGPSHIKPLNESVVNKIAAGEIIVAPVNALKEMIENSIDAGATSIEILVKDGGLKVLQVTDNGSGINKSDLAILCQRFTTSKLTTFEDLSSIQTFGFRGEALASISHIARVTVTTKTKEDACAWRVSYSAGKMLGEAKPTAGKNGTVILVEDLFYNVNSRLRALRSPNEEFAKILECVGRYSINAAHVGFSCKKFGESQFALAVRASSNAKERIRSIFGRAVASELVEFKMPENMELGISAHGQVSNLNFVSKKAISPVLFINNRLVTCDPIRRALNQVYASFLAKGNKPFIFLSLKIRPDLVDVNVHPTKREVRFLHDDEIIEQLSSQLENTLSSVDTSRSFKTTSIFTPNPVSIREGLGQPHSHLFNNMPITPISSKIKRQENKLVRIDASQNKITSYLKTTEYSPPAVKGTDSSQNFQAYPNEVPEPHTPQTQGQSTPGAQNGKNSKYTTLSSQRVDVNLASIKSLRKLVDSETDKKLTNIFANLTYVGVVDEQRRLAAIQHDLRLFLVDYGSICYDLFYQMGLTDFANFGKIYLETSDDASNKHGLTVSSILKNISGTENDFIKMVLSKLWEMREMLDEYFSIELYGGEENLEAMIIKSLPLLLKNYMPPLSKLPHFFYRLGSKIDWSDETRCLQGILKQIALLYAPEVIERMDPDDDSVDEEMRARYITKLEQVANFLEETIFPCVKKRLLAPNSLKGSIVEVANLPGLYKIFERC